jgi:mannitol/fructose-specific phosphotransferase system IIA component
MSFSLPPDHVLLSCEFASKLEAIDAIGRIMLDAGDVTPAYARGLIEKENQYSTWITDGVALPHGTNEVKCEVRRNSVVVVQMPKGVDWGEGKQVYVAIGFAGQGDDEHVGLMASLAEVLQYSENIERLRSSDSVSEVIRIMNGNQEVAI